MKKYNELEIAINVFEQADVIRTSTPEGENNLPWVDVTAAKDSDVLFS